MNRLNLRVLDIRLLNNKSYRCYDCSFHVECCLALSLPSNTTAPHRSPGSLCTDLCTGSPLKAKSFRNTATYHKHQGGGGGGVHQPSPCTTVGV